MRERILQAGKLLLALGVVWMGADLAQAQSAAAASAPASAPAAASAPASTVAAAPNAAKLYAQHCAICHGEARTGGMGPALLPESLERLRPAEALAVITDGRVATQMPGFTQTLNGAEIAALAAYVRTPVLPAPNWDEASIRASRVAPADTDAAKPVARPIWKGDPMNLFVVVEAGDHHVSLVDGDRFEVITRFASRYALHGGPKFTPDGRFVYFGSRDGWITKYDLWRLRVVAEVRAGLNMRNVAVSGDGRWVLAGNYLPGNVVLFDADLNLRTIYPAATLDGKQTSRVSAVYDAEPRKSFIVAMKDIPELWEISYDPKAEPIFDGLVHDHKMGEAIAKPGYLGVRRTPLSVPLDDFFFDAPYRHLIGSARVAPGQGASAQVINLDARVKVADLPVAGMPHLGSGIGFTWQGHPVVASPNLKDGAIDVVDLKDWKIVATVPTPGPGFFIRSHEKTRYAWADSMMSPTAKDTLTLIDKQTLKPAATLREPGKTLAHTEFTKDGRFALVSVWEQDGALIVYDAETLKEVKRLPMKKPVGKYNVWNKISRSEGTSH